MIIIRVSDGRDTPTFTPTVKTTKAPTQENRKTCLGVMADFGFIVNTQSVLFKARFIKSFNL